MVSVVAAGCALAGFAEGFVVAKDGTAACAVVAGAAIDAPPPFVLSFQLFEGEKTFESPVRPNGSRVASSA